MRTSIPHQESWSLILYRLQQVRKSKHCAVCKLCAIRARDCKEILRVALLGNDLDPSQYFPSHRREDERRN